MEGKLTSLLYILPAAFSSLTSLDVSLLQEGSTFPKGFQSIAERDRGDELKPKENAPA